MMQLLRPLVILVAGLSILIADAAETTALDAIRANGALRVGTTGDYQPFSYRNGNGEYLGLDIDMAASLARALGVRLELVPTTWPTLMQDLAAHRFDIAMGGVSVTAERQKYGLFSQPYLHDGKTAIARCAEKTRFATLADIDRAPVRVIVNPGGTNERFVRSRLHQATVMAYPDNVTIFDQLLAGKADVMITDAIEARLQQRLRPGLCALHPDTPFEAVDKAYLLPQDQAFKAVVDVWLAQAQASGEFDASLERWLAYDWNGAARSDARVAALLALMRERLVIAADVARSKWNSGTPIEDPKRESDIVAALAGQAGEMGLPVPWAEQFFRAQIEASKNVQRELHARWRAQGQGKFDDAPDLARDIRPRLDALTPRLLAALAAARPVLCDAARPDAIREAGAVAVSPDVSPTAMKTAVAAFDITPACAP